MRPRPLPSTRPAAPAPRTAPSAGMQRGMSARGMAACYPRRTPIVWVRRPRCRAQYLTTRTATTARPRGGSARTQAVGTHRSRGHTRSQQFQEHTRATSTCATPPQREPHNHLHERPRASTSRHTQCMHMSPSPQHITQHPAGLACDNTPIWVMRAAPPPRPPLLACNDVRPPYALRLDDFRRA